MPHQDYLFWGKNILPDQIFGVWIALEDINPFSSPLYLVRHSHLNLTNPFFNYSDISCPAYRSELVEYMKLNDVDILAPKLKAGDCILWDSRLIHGALQSQDFSLTRKSLTSHYTCSKTARLFAPTLKRLLKSNFIHRSASNVCIPVHSTRIFDLHRKN